VSAGQIAMDASADPAVCEGQVFTISTAVQFVNPSA